MEQFQRLNNSVELLDQESEFDGLELGELNNADISLVDSHCMIKHFKK